MPTDAALEAGVPRRRDVALEVAQLFAQRLAFGHRGGNPKVARVLGCLKTADQRQLAHPILRS